jgi:hypothetical protein
MFNCRRYISPTLPLSFSEKEKLGKPKEEIGNLKIDLNICILVISRYNICNLNICILVILRYNTSNLNILHIHISYFHGHDMDKVEELSMRRKWGSGWPSCLPSSTALPYRWSVLRAIHTLKTPQKYTRLVGGVSPINSMHRRGAQGLMWGAREPCPLVAAMVVVVVTPFVFVLRLLKKATKKN